jgi:hypothetical protein
MTIVTLSSIPPRFDKLEPTLRCLLNQSAKIERIILYIPERYRRFGDWDGTLPQVPEGVEIRRVPEDIGPATKILYAAQEFRGQDVDLLLCDDDRRYKPGWAQAFLEARAQRPDEVIAIAGFEASRYGQSQMKDRPLPRATPTSRARDLRFQARMVWEFLFPPVQRKYLREPTRVLFKAPGYVDCFEGFGGALVKPDFFDDSAFEIPEVIWAVDDVWLSGCLARKGVRIWALADQHDTQHTPAGVYDALHKATIEGADRDDANMACIKHFQEAHGVWL